MGINKTLTCTRPTTGIATLTWQPALPSDQLSPSQPLHARIGRDRPLRSFRVTAQPAGRVNISSVSLGDERLTEKSQGLCQVASPNWPTSKRAIAASLVSFLLISTTFLLLSLIWRQKALVNPVVL